MPSDGPKGLPEEPTSQAELALRSEELWNRVLEWGWKYGRMQTANDQAQGALRAAVQALIDHEVAKATAQQRARYETERAVFENRLQVSQKWIDRFQGDLAVAAIAALEQRERYEAIVEFMEWDDVSHWPGCSGDLGYPCKCGVEDARAALAALREEQTT